MNIQTKDNYLSARNIAELVGINFKTVLRWIKENKLHSITLPGGTNKVTRKDLIKFLNNQSIPVPETLKEEAKKILIYSNDRDPKELKKIIGRYDGFVVKTTSENFELGLLAHTLRPKIIVLYSRDCEYLIKLCKLLRKSVLTRFIRIIVISDITKRLNAALMKSGKYNYNMNYRYSEIELQAAISTLIQNDG